MTNYKYLFAIFNPEYNFSKFSFTPAMFRILAYAYITNETIVDIAHNATQKTLSHCGPVYLYQLLNNKHSLIVVTVRTHMCTWFGTCMLERRRPPLQVRFRGREKDTQASNLF